MMKIIGSAIVAATVLASGASAFESTGIYAGVDRVDVEDGAFNQDGTGVTIGIDGRNTLGNGFAWGAGGGLSYINMELGENGDTPMYTLDMNLKLGYVPVTNLFVYGVGGVVAQYINYDNDPVTSYGFEYGAGVEYKVLDSIAVNLEHKRSGMDGEGDVRNIDYDYDKTSLNLKYLF